MTLRFEHESHAQRVRFGAGEADAGLRAEVGRLGPKRIMVIASGSARVASERITAGLPVACRYYEVARHVPVGVARRARQAAEECRADTLVCVGGGSATGLAKAVALTSGLPIVAVPTTYAGSEASSVWGLTEQGRKTTGVDVRVLPRAVVYDAALTVSLPVPDTVASAMNALAHGVDAMWAPRSDPINRALAVESIQAMTAALPAIAADPAGLDAREQALYAGYLAGTVFSSAGSGLHHKICHVLGGRYDLPHAQTHAVVLPYVLAFNAPAAPEADQRLGTAFGAPDGLSGLQRLRDRVDAPRSLRELGMPPADISALAAATLPVVPEGNPTTPTLENLTRLLRAAWEGADPV